MTTLEKSYLLLDLLRSTENKEIEHPVHGTISICESTFKGEDREKLRNFYLN
jgi:hypothetical protein